MYRKLIVTIITIAVMFTMTFSTGFVYADDAAKPTEPEGIPIYTAEQFLSLSDRDGKYYLANDIDLKDYPNCSINFFAGVLDGNGHAIYNYTVDENFDKINNTEFYKSLIRIGLFQELNKATIKNLDLENVNINYIITDDRTNSITTLGHTVNGVSFENVAVSGDINVKVNADTNRVLIEGMVWSPFGYDNFENCVSDIDISCEVLNGKIHKLFVMGMGNMDCSSETKTIECRNTGDIKVIVHENAKVDEIKCHGLFFHEQTYMNNLVSCGNTGTISIENYGKIKSVLSTSGVTNYTNSISKCYNKGDINVKGRFRNIYIGGITATTVYKASQSYNKGNISLELTAKPEENKVYVSGLAGHVKKSVTNSYNAGKIICSGKWNGGYVTGLIDTCDSKCKITSCYNSGKITLPSGVKYGSIAREKKGTLKNNYFRRGTAFISGTAKSSQAKKVDAISKKNCSGLSSDYWTYSKSKKRMILKNNKEI